MVHNLHNLKHISFRCESFQTLRHGFLVLALLSRIEPLESMSLDSCIITDTDVIQQGWNMVLPKLKKLEIISEIETTRQMMRIISQYPDVLPKLETLRFDLRGNPHHVLQVRNDSHRHKCWTKAKMWTSFQKKITKIRLSSVLKIEF